MEKLSREKLVRLAIVIAVLIVILIILATLLYKKETPTNREEQEKIYKKAVLLNNDDRVIQYGNEVFYISNFKDSNLSPYVIASIPANFDEEAGTKTPSIIATKNMANPSSRLFMYNNCLYYTYGDDTYEYNLLEKTTRTFCDGKLQYITSNFFVSLDNGDLYKGEYYPTTHSVKRLQALTTESYMIKLCEDEDTIFYDSGASKETRLIVGLNKSNYNLKIYYRYNVKEYELSSAISNNNSLILLIQNIKGATETFDISSKPTTIVAVKKKDLSTTENLLENKYIKGEIEYISNNKEKKAICKFVTENNASETYELNLKNLKLTKYDEKTENYEVKTEKNEIIISKGENEIARYASKLGKINSAYISNFYKVGDYIYFDVIVYGNADKTSGEGITDANGEYELMFLRVNKNGGKTYKINQKNINVVEK